MAADLLAGWVDAAIVGTVACAVLAVAFRHLTLRPGLRHLLWLVVALRFLVPATPSWSWTPVGDRVDVWLAGSLAPTLRPPPAPRDVPEPTAGGTPAVDPAGSALPIPWQGLVLILWLGSALAVFVARFARYRRWRSRLTRRVAPPPATLVDDVRISAARLEVAAPTILVSPDIATPMVAGCRRPVLLWPASMPGTVPANARRAIVAHEIAHLRRRDPWLGWIEMLVASAWWWYPPARRVCREVAAAAEESCDRWAVSLFPADRRSYAEALCAVAERVNPSPVPALVSPLSLLSVLERRIAGIAKDRSAPGTGRRERSIAVLAALVILPVGIVTGGSVGHWSPNGEPMSGIIGRGDAALSADGTPLVEGEGWLAAFRWVEGELRTVIATSDGTVAIDGSGQRSSLERTDRDWLRALARETQWDVDARTGLSSSGAVVPGGPHHHRASERETIAVWSGVATPFDRSDRLGLVARDRPVVAATWTAADPVVRLYRLWRDKEGAVRGDVFTSDGRSDLPNADSTASAIARLSEGRETT